MSRIWTADFETWKAGGRRLGRFIGYSSGIPKILNRARFRHERDVLFIWVPKNAGTSIHSWLDLNLSMMKLKEPFAVRGGFPNIGPVTFAHMDVEALIDRGFVSEDYMARSFKFGITRNPYTRALSLYRYLTKRNKVKSSFTDFLKRVSQGVEPIGLYNSKGWSQANQQVCWLYRHDGKPLFDRLWKMEELSFRLDELRETFGITGAPPLMNQSSRQIMSMSGRDVDLVRQIYSDDFERLGYSIDIDKCIPPVSVTEEAADGPTLA